jgi:tripartite-type tricarboxylate transporter receptor subunit TctC
LGEQLRLSRALDLVHVPFNGAGPAVASVVAGHTPIGFSTLASATTQIQAGQIRVLAVTSKARSQLLADVPTTAEAGYADIEGDGWVGALVPAGSGCGATLSDGPTSSRSNVWGEIVRRAYLRTR